MRTARKLVLALAGALAAMALVTSNTSAAVEISQESGGHCPAVSQPTPHSVAGGCLIHAASLGPSTLYNHITTPVVAEVVFSSCSSEFSARVNEAGTGFIFNQILTDPPSQQGACGVTPCDEVEPSHADRLWPVRVEEDAGQEFVHFVFCIRLLVAGEGSSTPCEVRRPINPAGHTGTFGSVTETPCLNLGGVIELVGQWQTETGGVGETAAEITHP